MLTVRRIYAKKSTYKHKTSCRSREQATEMGKIEHLQEDLSLDKDKDVLYRSLKKGSVFCYCVFPGGIKRISILRLVASDTRLIEASCPEERYNCPAE